MNFEKEEGSVTQGFGKGPGRITRGQLVGRLGGAGAEEKETPREYTHTDTVFFSKRPLP